MFLKKYKDLKTENKGLREALELKKEEIARLRAKLNGERVCGGYCSVCKHSYLIHGPFSIVPSYGCQIDCGCKDFEKKD